MVTPYFTAMVAKLSVLTIACVRNSGASGDIAAASDDIPRPATRSRRPSSAANAGARALGHSDAKNKRASAQSWSVEVLGICNRGPVHVLDSLAFVKPPTSLATLKA
jgi:hypothetical protein